MTNHPKLAALAVVIREDLVLLVKRRSEPDAGLWSFPGGHDDFGETVMEAVARELREESGDVGRPVHYLTNVDVVVRERDGAVRFHFLQTAVF